MARYGQSRWWPTLTWASQGMSRPRRDLLGRWLQAGGYLAGGYRVVTWQVVTGGYRWLQVVTGGYRWLQVVTGRAV
jgi:hypothetical protein